MHQTPQPRQDPNAYDQIIKRKFNEAASKIVDEHPEIRSVGIVLDWEPRFAANAEPFLWLAARQKLGDEVTIATASAMGGTSQTLKLLTFQLQTLFHIVAAQTKLLEQKETDAQTEVPSTTQGEKAQEENSTEANPPGESSQEPDQKTDSGSRLDPEAPEDAEGSQEECSQGGDSEGSSQPAPD